MSNPCDSRTPQTDFYGKEIREGDRLLFIGLGQAFTVALVEKVYLDRVTTAHPGGHINCGFSLDNTHRNTIILPKEPA